MTEDDQMKAFQEDFGVTPQTSEPKGKGYIELLVDNIVGLDNDYESFGEAFGKSFNEDELDTLKNMALSAYEGAKEFVTSPIETTKDVATEISDSVSRLGAESLDGRIRRMYGVGYQDATEEQVTKAREAVIGDAITASSLVPAAKGATTVAKAAIPVTLSGTAARVFSKDSRPDIPFQRDILDDTEFEPLDEETLFPKAKTKATVPPAKFTGDQVLTPEEGLASIKSDNLYETTQYDPTTMLGQIAYNKKKVLDNLKDKELLKLAQDLPHYKDKDYWNFLDSNIKPVASYLGVDENDFLSLLNDIGGYYPAKKDPQLQELTEKPLPEKAPLGPRAGAGPERPSDKKAEALGFKDTVYHTSTKKGPFVDFPEEFTEFDLASSTGSDRTSQDLLGVHVGTARAAAERNLYVREDPVVGEAGDAKGYTMELRARTTDPVTKQEISKMFKKKPEELFDDPTGPFTEMDVNTLIREYEDLLYPADTLLPADSREVAAVNFRRELAREGFTHIPYINDVEDPGSISFIMLVDRPKGSPAVLRDVRAQFDPKKITSPDLRFAEGGMVEEDQMRRLMQEGGMADDGMSIEPVTGNEIPPGSLSSEVRDDIPAQLSEGEYVVPADVVRFFGVRFFEELRNQAKQGLAEMDADGRIGGTPVDSQGVPMEGQDEELTPEEEQALMEALGATGTGMAEGGLSVPMSNPYQDQSMLYQPPKAIAGAAPVGMNEGGLLGQTFTGFESRRYYNPETKQEMTINFLDGRPLGIIPTGFVPWTPELAAAQETPTETEIPEGMGAQDDDKGRDERDTVSGDEGAGYGGWAEKNAEAINSDPLGFGMNALDSKQGFLSDKQMAGIAGMVNPALGLGVMGAKTIGSINDIALARASVEVAKAKGLNTTGLESKIDQAVEALPGAVRGLVRNGVIGSGETYATKALEFSGAAAPSRTGMGVSTGSDRATEGGQRDVSRTTSGKDLSFGKTTAGKSVDTGTIDMGAKAPSLSFGKTTAGKSVSTGPTTSDKGLSMGTPAGGSKSTGGTRGGSVGARATGGLVSKKSSPKPKGKKGLAS